MYFNTRVNATPTAFITKDKQRLKQNGTNVYLSNGEEFEIELFNPTQLSILAKIKINGTYLSGGGIVVKPGQRIFLERYLDVAKKFKFDIYEVEGSSYEALVAIQKNGLIEIDFFEEKQIHPVMSTWETYGYNPVIGDNSSGTYYQNPTFATNGLGYGSISTYCSNVSYRSDDFKPKTKLKKETGRIEKGSNSSQSFSSVDMDFNSYPSKTISWKILPKSEQPIESKDIKVYCTECGTKRKKDNHKFCPICGTKY